MEWIFDDIEVKIENKRYFCYNDQNIQISIKKVFY
jgi:hypothetical protein